jgi:hypothetical protein
MNEPFWIHTHTSTTNTAFDFGRKTKFYLYLVLHPIIAAPDPGVSRHLNPGMQHACNPVHHPVVQLVSEDAEPRRAGVETSSSNNSASTGAGGGPPIGFS